MEVRGEESDTAGRRKSRGAGDCVGVLLEIIGHAGDEKTSTGPISSPTVFRMELVYVAASQQLDIRLIDEGSADALYDTVTGVDLSGFGSSWAGFWRSQDPRPRTMTFAASCSMVPIRAGIVWDRCRTATYLAA